MTGLRARRGIPHTGANGQAIDAVRPSAWLSGAPGGILWPAVSRCDNHSDTGHTREVTSLGQPSMGTGRSLDGNPPALRHLVTRGYRLAWLVLAVSDLTFQHTRYLEVARYSGEII